MKIGLSLSGGGFRATLFHLGVLQFMQEARILADTKYIASVSGGSIVAAHAVLNWDSYLDGNVFVPASSEIRRFASRDVRGRILRRWPLYRVGRMIWEAPEWTLTGLFQKQLSNLYGRKTLKDLVVVGGPLLEILGTSMSNSRPCAFRGDEGLFIDRLVGGYDFVKASHIPITFAVAASAAFPPMFPPLELSATTIGVTVDELPTKHFITDGGVFDNLGIQMLKWTDSADGENLELSHILMSDASAPFGSDFSDSYTNPFTRQTRASDVMMKRNSDLLLDALTEDNEFSKKLIQCRIGDIDLDFGADEVGRLHSALCRSIPTARTDLDAFSTLEVDLIVRHGYLVAKKAWIHRLELEGKSVGHMANLFPESGLKMPLPRSVVNAPMRQRIKLPWQWDWHDPFSWAYASFVLVVICIALAGIQTLLPGILHSLSQLFEFLSQNL